MPDVEREPAAALVTALCVAARMLAERWAMQAVDATLRSLFASFARLDAQLADAEFAALSELAFRALASRADVGRELPYTRAAACAALEPVLLRRVASERGACDVALLVPCASLDKAHWERVAALAEFAGGAARVLAQSQRRDVASMHVRLVQLCALSGASDKRRAQLVETSYARAVDIGAAQARVTLELWFVDELQFSPLDAACHSPHRPLAALDEPERARDRLRTDRQAEKAPGTLPVLRVASDPVVRWHAFARGAVVRVERRALDEGGTAFHYVRCE